MGLKMRSVKRVSEIDCEIRCSKSLLTSTRGQAGWSKRNPVRAQKRGRMSFRGQLQDAIKDKMHRLLRFAPSMVNIPHERSKTATSALRPSCIPVDFVYPYDGKSHGIHGNHGIHGKSRNFKHVVSWLVSGQQREPGAHEQLTY